MVFKEWFDGSYGDAGRTGRYLGFGGNGATLDMCQDPTRAPRPATAGAMELFAKTGPASGCAHGWVVHGCIGGYGCIYMAGGPPESMETVGICPFWPF